MIYVLHNIRNPEAYGGLPSSPQIPLLVKLWKGPMKWLGGLAMVGGILSAVLHSVRFGHTPDYPLDKEKELREPKA